MSKFSTILKTYENDLDGISNKLGFSKRTFAEWGSQVSTSFKEAEVGSNKLYTAFNKLWGATKTAFVVPKEELDWKRTKSGDIVTEDNIDSYILQISRSDAKEFAQSIRKESVAVSAGTQSWDDYFNTLENDGLSCIVDLIKNTDDLSKITGEDLVRAIQKARQDALDHNAALGQQTLGAKAAKKALKAVSVVGNALLSMGLSMLISAITGKIVEWTQAQENAIAAADEAISKFNEERQALAKAKTTIDDISDDYKKLADGVDNLGRNVSLNSEEYAQYNNIVNQIAEMFPQMVQGYTDEGKAIIKHKGDVEKLTQAYENQKKTAQDAIIVGAAETFKGFKAKVSDYATAPWTKNGSLRLKRLTDEIISTQGDAEAIKKIINNGTSGLEIRDLYEKLGLDFRWLRSDKGYAKDLSEHFTSILSLANTLNTEIESETAKVKPVMQAYLDKSFELNKVDSATADLVKQIVNQFDAEFYNQFDNETEMATWIDKNIVKKLQDKDIKAQFTAALDLQTQFNEGNIPVKDYQDKINALLELIKNFPEETKKSIMLLFGIETDEKGNPTSEVDTMLENVKKKLDGKYGKELGGLTKNELETLSGLDAREFANVEEWADVEKILEDAAKGAKDLTLSLSELEKTSDNISKLQTAFKEVSDDGYVTVKTLKEIQEATGLSGDEWVEYETKILNAKKGTAEWNKTLSELTVKILDNTIELGDLTTATDAERAALEKKIAATLRENGVSNGEAVAHSYVTQKLAEQTAKTIAAEIATDKFTGSITDLAKQCGVGEKALTAMTLKQMQLQNTKLNLTQQIGELTKYINTFKVALGLEDWKPNKYGNYVLSREQLIEMGVVFKKGSTGREGASYNGKWYNTYNELQSVVIADYLYKQMGTTEKDVDYSGITAPTYTADTKSDKSSTDEKEDKKPFDDNYYSYVDTWLEEAQKQAEKLEKGIEETNRRIEHAVEAGDVDLVNILTDKKLTKLTEKQDLHHRQADANRQTKENLRIALSSYLPSHLNNMAWDEEEKDEIRNQLASYNGEGLIDFTVRPQIDTSKLAEKGWEDVGEGIATVFSSTFYSEDFGLEAGKALVVTPILPDGTVLTPGELENYAYKMLNGEEVDVDIKMGLFDGVNYKEDADNLASTVHNLHEGLFSDGNFRVELQKYIDGLKQTIELTDDEDEKNRLQKKVNMIEGILGDIDSVSDAITEASDAWWELDSERAEAYKSMADTQDEFSQNWIDNQQHFNKLTEADEMKAYERKIKHNKDYLDKVLKDTKLSEEAKAALIKYFNDKITEDTKSAYSAGISALQSVAEKALDDYEEEMDARTKALELLRSKKDSRATLLQKYFDVINTVSDTSNEIYKQLRASKAMAEYLDEDTRKLLFNDDDYNALSKELETINAQADRLRRDYERDITGATTETLEEITSYYEKQYELLVKSYEIKKAELEVAKKEQQLNNVLNEKNVRMRVNGEWIYVANTQDVIDAQNELADAQQELLNAENGLSQQKELNELSLASDRLGTEINLLEKCTEDFRKQWEKLSEKMFEANSDVTEVLQAIKDGTCTELKDILDLCGSEFTSWLNNLTGANHVWRPTNVSSSKADNSNVYYSTATAPNGMEMAIKIKDGKTITEGLEPGTIVHTQGGDYKVTGGTAGNYKAEKIKAKYASGTKSTTSGNVLMGEDGFEAFISKNGHLIPINQPTIANVDSGGIVFNTEQMSNLRNLFDLSNIDSMPQSILSNTVSRDTNNVVNYNMYGNAVFDGNNPEEIFQQLGQYMTHNRFKTK